MDRTKRTLLIIIAASTLLKIVLLVPTSALRPLNDETQYLAGARSIVETGVPKYAHFLWDEAHAAPLYPYAMGAVLAVVGDAAFPTVFRLIQIVLGAITVLLVYRLTDRLFGRREALVAAALAGLYPTLVGYAHFFLSETLFIFLLVALVTVLVTGTSPPSAGRCLAAGLLAGLAALTRSAMVPLLAFVVLWLLVTGSGGVRQRAGSIVALLLGAAIVVAPWSVRNTLRYDRFLLIDTNAGNVIYQNVNVLKPENHDIGLGASRRKQLGTYRGPVPLRMRAKDENIVDRQRAEIRAGIDFVREHPDIHLRNSAIRAVELLHPTSFVVLHIRVAEKREQLGSFAADALVTATVASVMVAMILGVFGLLTRAPTNGRLLLLLLILGQALVCVGLISSSRYRLPLMALTIPFMAAAIVQARDWLDPSRWRRWLVAGTFLVFMIVVWTRYLPYNYMSPEELGWGGPWRGRAAPEASERESETPPPVPGDE